MKNNVETPGAQVTASDEKAAFEDWAVNVGQVAYRDYQHGLCFYYASAKHAYWFGWEARAKLVGQSPAQVTGEPVATDRLTGVQAAALFIEKRAEDYLRDHASTDDDTGAISWHHGDAGREYHDNLIELAEDLRKFFDQQADSRARINAYTVGNWFEARTVDEMQAFYLSRLPSIREVAKEHGYAIGLHGSTRRDFDLMAMQWRENASDKDTLARAIADAACAIRRDGAYEWEQKPNGRVAVSIPVCWTAHDNPELDKPSAGHIDLSLIAAPVSTHSGAQVPSIDTPEFRELLGDFADAKMVAGREFGARNLIAYIDRHIATHSAPADRDAIRDQALEDAARWVEDYQAEGEHVSFNDIAFGIRKKLNTQPSASPTAASEQPTDKQLLDDLDAWVQQNKEAGHEWFNFAFDAKSTARQQLAADMAERAASPTATDAQSQDGGGHG